MCICRARELSDLTANLMEAPSEVSLEAVDKKVAAMMSDQSFADYSKGLELIQARINGIRNGLQTKSDIRLDCLGLRNKVLGIFKICFPEKKDGKNGNWIWDTWGSYKKTHLKEIEEYIIREKVDVSKCFCIEGELFPSLLKPSILESNRSFEIIKLMLRAGVDINNPPTYSPVFAICCAFDNYNSDERKIELLKLLIDEGLDTNQAFQFASSLQAKFPLQFLQMIIDAGADVNACVNGSKNRDWKVVDLTWYYAYDDQNSVNHDPLSLFYGGMIRSHDSLAYEQMAQRAELLLFNGAVIDLTKFENSLNTLSRRTMVEGTNSEVVARQAKNAKKRKLVYESIAIRDGVFTEIPVKRLAEVPALQSQAVDVLRIITSYMEVTVEDISKDSVLRKLMLERCLAKKASKTAS